MGSNVRFKRNPAGYKAVMKSDAMASVCLASASRIAAAAGDGHAADVQVGVSRVHARASTTTDKARRKEFDGAGPLKRAAGAGRI